LTESVRLSAVTQLIVGEGSTAEALAQTLGQVAETAGIWAASGPVTADDPGSSAPLARELTRFEAEAVARKPDSVILADDSDASLAAALVATKLLVPLAAVDAAMRPSSANGRLIAQLADAYTRPA
jgi:hypothetical protein